MESFMQLSSEHGSSIYRLMYMLAFAVAISIFVYMGFRAGYPKRTWLWITLSGVVFFILGNKLLTISPAQWLQFFQDFQIPDTGKHSLLGGILGVILGAYLGAKWLRFPFPVLDKLAIALPVGMAITRVGCLFAGCCFGTPADLPWALTYDAASLPGHIQLSQGLIHSGAHCAHPIHPVQLYDIICCLFIIVLVWCTRNRWRAPGSKFLFMLACYGFFRFSLEFFRDPSTDGYLGGALFGLKAIQWALVLAIMITLLILVIRERKWKFIKIYPGMYTAVNVREWALFIAVFIFILAARKWLEIIEMTTILIIFIPLSFLLFAKSYTQILIRPLRRIAPLLLAAMFIMTAQTLPDEGNKIVYKEYGFGYMTGIYQKTVREFKGTKPSCWGGYSIVSGDSENHSYYFNTLGFQLSENQIQNKYRRLSYGFGVNAALESETETGGELIADHFYFGVNGFFKYDWRWFGLLGGLQAGYFNIAGLDRGANKNTEKGIYIDGPAIGYVLPRGSIRLGPYDIFYVKADFFNHFPTASPMPLTKFGIGSGLGKTNGTMLSIGYSGWFKDFIDAGFFIHFIYPIKEKFVVEAFYADPFKSGIDDRRMLSLAFHYRLKYKTVPKKR